MKREKKFAVVLLIILILFSDSISSKPSYKIISVLQTIEKDSLKNKSYKNLKDSYYNSGNDFMIASIYANAYLDRAKNENNNAEIANGFLFLSEISNEKKALKYADSIILYGEKSKNKELLIKGNIQKGIQHYYLAEYDKSLEKLLDAQKIAVEENNEFQQVVIKHHIGNLKNVTKQREEALDIFRSNIKYFNKDINDLEEKRQYLKSLFRLANVYNVLRKLDSAEIINKIGIKEALETENRYMYPLFLACYGSTLQLSGRTNMALDSLKKSARLTNNRKARLASIYLIICKIENQKGNYRQYENYLLKIDSMYTNHPETIKETKIAYEALINFHRRNKNHEQQLVFMNKLIRVDSILDIKFQNINKNIARNYENKKIISEKENIIKKLDKGKKQYSYFIFTMGIAIIGLLFLIYLFYKKKMIYQTRFDQLMKDQSSLKNQIKKPIKIKKQDSIPEEIATNISEGLKVFEIENKFLSKNISLKELATILKTNTSYLSFFINYYKKKNFSRYISDLRIQYTINKLTEDRTFRSYSIKAIANEVGFKSQEAFSKAFYKKTGLYPSYFIKNLQKTKS
ncbi:helix-turn-helix domain-containing protein [Aquimarina algiphila]|uniref:Helix-turn-helix domain-containing protein n=1 Tax=Aquimarina algiphila TaxID=2047982 RepID=A0A554VBA7_9FLAO|nr:helix-turn-helix domain-containing protein [Aquimarina algiphila]TSE03773.1 helix-turn-helix domain-containing protein [Aquimarina algiphila]